MLDWQRTWSQISGRDEFKGKRMEDFGYQAQVLRLTLTTLQVLSNQQQIFTNSAIVLGITAGADPTGLAAATQYRQYGLDLFALRCEWLNARQIIGAGASRAMASAVFGQGTAAQVPPSPLIMPSQATLMYELENLTSTTIEVFIVHHSMVPTRVG